MPAIVIAAIALQGAGMIIDQVQKHKKANAEEKAAIAAGEHQKVASESVAQLSEYNAAIADLQAKDAIERGAEQESRFRTQVRGLIGSQRTGFAAQNVDVGFGSPVDVQADTAYLGELDALQIKHNAQREAWGFSVSAEDLRKRADIARREGIYLERTGRENASAIGTASNWALAGSLVGGGASLLQMRYGFQSGSSAPTNPYANVPGGFGTMATGF